MNIWDENIILGKRNNSSTISNKDDAFAFVNLLEKYSPREIVQLATCDPLKAALLAIEKQHQVENSLELK